MNPAPIDLPESFLKQGSPHHNSLQSFFEHADRTKLNPLSPLYIGTHYESTSALALARFGLSLTRVGRTNDEGIDLIGHWVMTPLREPMPVIIQCKVRKSSLGPCHLRELEGSFGSVPAKWKKQDVLGIVVTDVKATRGVLEAMSRSLRPMVFAMISRQGLIQQFVWNRPASEVGLEGVGVTVRHRPIVEQDETTPPRTGAEAKPKTAGILKDIQLTWMGSPIFPERQVPHSETLDRVSPELPQSRPRKPPKGPKPTWHLAPKPRGGLFALTKKEMALFVASGCRVREHGRPKGAKNRLQKAGPVNLKRGAGRPKGVKDTVKRKRRSTAKEVEPPSGRKRGRPKGSKNKPKVPPVDGEAAVDTG